MSYEGPHFGWSPSEIHALPEDELNYYYEFLQVVRDKYTESVKAMTQPQR